MWKEWHKAVDFRAFSIEWLQNNLSGLSPKTKQLVRQYWERMPKETFTPEKMEEEEKESTMLRAELLIQAPTEERQAFFGIMQSVYNMKSLKVNLVKLAPNLFQAPQK